MLRSTCAMMALSAVLVGTCWAAEGPATQPAAQDLAASVGKARYLPKDYRPIGQRVQFLVFGDRNGREDPRLTGPAFDLANALHPEFVLSVGDQIEGYVEEAGKFPPEEIAQRNRQMWSVYDAYVSRLTVPYFYAVGNHDMWNKSAAAIYDELHGPTYYSFDYRGIHVIALNSEEQKHVSEAGGALGETQINWLKADLEKSRDASLTVIAMHNPLWAGTGKGWVPVEPLLAGRNCIVFAGHLHTYSYEVRKGIPYVIVAPTSAGQDEYRNDSMGIFNHVTLVTVDDGKPSLSVVKLGGAFAGETVTPEWRKRARPIVSASQLQYEPAEPMPGQIVTVHWNVTNPGRESVTIKLDWAPGSTWQFDSKVSSVTLAPKQTQHVEFTAFQPLAGADQPIMQATFSWQDSDIHPASLTWPVEPLRRIEAVPIKGIQVDGQIEKLWSKAKPVRFTAAHQFETGREYWHGPTDLSGQMRAAIDGTMLYLLAEVTDDDVVGDADEVVLTLGRAPLEEPRSSGSGSYYCWINPMKFWSPAKVNRDAKPRLEIQAVSGPRLNGYIMEIAVDITPLVDSLKDQPGLPFKFCFADADGKERWPNLTQAIWCGTGEALSSTRNAGLLVIPPAAREAAIQAAASQEAE